MQKLSHEIVEQVLNGIEEDVNITKIAKILQRNVSTIWFKISGNRKWDVETWLGVLNVLGIMKYKNGNIIIECKLSPGCEKKFKENHRRYF